MNITREALKEGKFFICCLLVMFLVLSNNFLSYDQCIADNVADETIQKDIYVNWILERSSKISRQTATDIYKAAMSMENGLLYIALMYRESNFDSTAVSSKGAIGITQIMPKIWTNVLIEQGIIKERRDLFDYDKSLLASKYILIKYYEETSCWKKALNKYVGKHKSYAKDVLATYGELQLLCNIKDTKDENSP